MPHRVIGLMSFIDVPLAAILTIIAAVAGVDNVTLTDSAILDKGQMRLWCIIGSVMGAFLAIAILPSRESQGNYHRRLALKFASSMILGAGVAPILIRWRGYPVDSDVLIFVSMTVALLAVGTISAAYPLWIKWVVRKISDDPCAGCPVRQALEADRTKAVVEGKPSV